MGDLELWSKIFDAGSTLALAVFAIWMLQRSYKERAELLEVDRDRLADVIDRNTKAWKENTQALAEISAGVAIVAEATSTNTENINHVLMELAKRLIEQSKKEKQ